MQLERSDFLFIRKAYSKKGYNSVMFNMPLEITKDLNIQPGDYLIVKKVHGGIFIRHLTGDELESNINLNVRKEVKFNEDL